MPKKQVIIILGFFLIILILGSLAYHFIERVNFLDSIYMTVITLTTVGFREVARFSTTGKILTMILALFSLVLIAGMVGVVNYFLFSGELKKIYRSSRMRTKVDRIKKHYILCGADEVGQEVIKEFMRDKAGFVVVDKNKDALEQLSELYRDMLWVWGDATDEQILRKAGTDRARGMVLALPSDADVLFTTITAKQINPEIQIVAQVADIHSMDRLYKAGVKHVILSKVLAGMRLSHLILKPSIISFLDILTQTDEFSLRLEEIELPKNSPFMDKTLSEAQIPQKTGLMVIAVRDRTSNHYVFNPSAGIRLGENIKLVVLGEEDKISNLRKYLS